MVDDRQSAVGGRGLWSPSPGTTCGRYCGRCADRGLVVLAFQLRFDFEMPPLRACSTDVLWVVVALQLSVFVAFGFYHRWWRYVSTRDVALAVGVRCLAVGAAPAVDFALTRARLRFPGVTVVDPLLLLAFVTGSRLLARTMIERLPAVRGPRQRGVVVGAGDAGELAIRELRRPPRPAPIGISTTISTKNLRPRRPPDRYDRRPALVLRDHRPDELLIALLRLGDFRQRIVKAARDEGVPVKTLPSYTS